MAFLFNIQSDAAMIQVAPDSILSSGEVEPQRYGTAYRRVRFAGAAAF
jgi:hypothetical protein